MKRAITIGTLIDFVCGTHYLRGGKVDAITHETTTLEVVNGPTRYFIDFRDVRRIHDRVAT
jgi:hypothetical protein